MEPEGKPRSITPARDVDRRCGTTPAQRWREERAGRFPQRIQITPSRIGYFEDEIDAWVANRPRGGASIVTPRSPGRPKRIAAATGDA